MLTDLVTAALDFAVLTVPVQFVNFHFVVVPAEERLLRRKFGAEFAAYCQQTGRWCPWF